MKAILIIAIILFTSIFYGCSKNFVEPSFTENTVEIYVSNQSNIVNPVNIKITIDGFQVTQKYFTFDTGHTWEKFLVNIPLGTRTIKAETGDGSLILEREFTLTSQKCYIAIDYFNSGTEGPLFNYQISDTAFLFM